jgi:hypothetical protein
MKFELSYILTKHPSYMAIVRQIRSHNYPTELVVFIDGFITLLQIADLCEATTTRSITTTNEKIQFVEIETNQLTPNEETPL